MRPEESCDSRSNVTHEQLEVDSSGRIAPLGMTSFSSYFQRNSNWNHFGTTNENHSKRPPHFHNFAPTLRQHRRVKMRRQAVTAERISIVHFD